jgi:hypothetical protein
VIAEVQQLEDREVAVRERILADVDLNGRAAVRQHQEIRLAEAPDGEDAAGGAGLDDGAFELFTRLQAVRPHQIADRVAPLERPGIRLHAQLRELLEVRASLAHEIGVEGGVGHVRSTRFRRGTGKPSLIHDSVPSAPRRGCR